MTESKEFTMPSIYSDRKKKTVTFRDVLNSMKSINLFISFSLKLSKFFDALSQIGVDVSKLNPYNFEDMVKMAASLRQRGIDVDFGDLDELMDEFNELMDMDIDEVVKHATILRKYSSVMKSVFDTVKRVSRTMPKDNSEIKAMMGMFGFNQSVDRDEDFSDVETTTLSEEDVREFKEIIRKYRGEK